MGEDDASRHTHPSTPLSNPPREDGAGPSNPYPPRGEEAGPSNPYQPFPYGDDELIGGGSVASLHSKLLAEEDNPSSERIYLARLEAEDLFEAKGKVIQLMTHLDPEGDWERRGALALHNPRTATGEEPLERLYDLHEELSSKGRDSAAFHSLKERVLRR